MYLRSPHYSSLAKFQISKAGLGVISTITIEINIRCAIISFLVAGSCVWVARLSYIRLAVTASE